jgi:RNA polymerase sigma-70 factor (ECF subfamily)
MTPEEFQRAYQAVDNRLYTFLLRVTGNVDEAKELLQESVYKAFRKRSSFRRESDFSTWIYRIALNTRKNYQKRYNIEQKYIKNTPSLPDTASATPEEIFIGKEKQQDLAMALNLLNEKYRIPLLLKHLEGYGYKEISEMLGIGENAVRKRVYRARHVLQSILGEVPD